MSQVRELSADELWNRCDPTTFAFETTADLPGEVTIIGQERAVESISFGVQIESIGFNIYALGETGTGRTTTIRSLVNKAAAARPVPNDWVYVNNFVDGNRPRAICLPPGVAAPFAREMQELVADLLREIPRAFESEEYERQREGLAREVQGQRDQVLSDLEARVNEQGFALVQTAQGIGFAPVLNGEVLDPEAYENLDAKTQQEIESHQAAVQNEFVAAMRRVRDLDRSAKQRLLAFDRDVASAAVSHLVDDVKSQFGRLPEVSDYLAEAQSDLVTNVAAFRQQEESGEGLEAAMEAAQPQDLLRRYRVNVLVDHSQQQGAPVIIEDNPTYGNLVGRIEHRSEMGTLVTDFSMIKAGALHRANGGYLVVEADSVLDNTQAWEALKRAIKNRQIRTEEMGSQMQLVSTETVEPEPIPLDVKVVLIGDAYTYYMLHEHDKDFGRLFKVQADFGADFPRTPATNLCYAQFIAARCREEGLLPLDRAAVARIIEHGSRLADHQKKLSTQFGKIADLVREACFWAKQAGRAQVTADDVRRAEQERVRRANRVEEEIQDLIDEGTLRVDVAGQAVGQVNGLSVLSVGNYAFGRPSRITVRTFSGKEGVVSLDREAKLSGRIYDKGLLTLDGFLGGKYAQEAPLSLSASISFEQLYEEVEGDSASSAELYALLSSLSGLSLRQGLAATGSVDQQGNIQPVGGVNEKIEGFYDVCRHRGLNGEQGVLLPAQNVVNLMLRDDVRQAVAEGRFHVYPVRTIDEGLEILTGVPAGSESEDGDFPAGSVHGQVMARLNKIADHLRDRDLEGEEEQPDPAPGTEDAPET